MIHVEKSTKFKNRKIWSIKSIDWRQGIDWPSVCPHLSTWPPPGHHVAINWPPAGQLATSLANWPSARPAGHLLATTRPAWPARTHSHTSISSSCTQMPVVNSGLVSHACSPCDGHTHILYTPPNSAPYISNCRITRTRNGPTHW